MIGKFGSAGVVAALLAVPVQAETFDINMLNKGDSGRMVFEPAYVAAAPGDTINFLSVDRGHNAETIDGMVPDGAETFKSKLGKDFSVTLTEEGLYGIKCTPHYSMGMVALIQVGEPGNRETAEAVKQRGKAKQRFEPLFDQVQ